MTHAEWLSALREGSLIFLGIVGFFAVACLIGATIAWLEREERKK